MWTTLHTALLMQFYEKCICELMCVGLDRLTQANFENAIQLHTSSSFHLAHMHLNIH